MRHSYELKAHTAPDGDALLLSFRKLAKNTTLFLQIVIDVSGSMLPHRDRLTHGVSKFFEKAERPMAVQLVVFSSEPRLLCSVSNVLESKEECVNALERMSIFGGTNIEAGLTFANDLLVQRESSDDDETVVRFFLSDGQANLGNTDNAYLASLFAPCTANFFMFTAQSDHELARRMKKVHSTRNVATFCSDAESLEGLVQQALEELVFGLDQVTIKADSMHYHVPPASKQHIMVLPPTCDVVHVTVNGGARTTVPIRAILEKADPRWVECQLAICRAYDVLKPLNNEASTNPDFDAWEQVDAAVATIGKLEVQFRDAHIHDSAAYRSLSCHAKQLDELNPHKRPPVAAVAPLAASASYRSLTTAFDLTTAPHETAATYRSLGGGGACGFVEAATTNASEHRRVALRIM